MLAFQIPTVVRMVLDLLDFQIITNYLFNVIIDLMRPRFTKVKTLIFEFSIGISMKKNCSRRENNDSRA